MLHGYRKPSVVGGNEDFRPVFEGAATTTAESTADTTKSTTDTTKSTTNTTKSTAESTTNTAESTADTTCTAESTAAITITVANRRVPAQCNRPERHVSRWC